MASTTKLGKAINHIKYKLKYKLESYSFVFKNIYYYNSRLKP